MGASGGERFALAWLADHLPRPPAGEAWIGDDAAVVGPPPAGAMMVEGVHWEPGLCSAADVGWKALAANLSDLAAMGGRPGHALVSVAGPAHLDLEGLYEGLLEAAAAYGCPVVGGDLSADPVVLVSVAVTGEVGPLGPGPVLRSGAEAGDTVFVTGPLGASAAGLRSLRSAGAVRSDRLVAAHRRPRPLLDQGEAARIGGATAMIDVSDGLALDLARVAEASGVGITLDRVPVAEGATEEEALGGGEDYELAFTGPDPDRLGSAFADRGLPPPVRIGACTQEAGSVELQGRRLDPSGFEHWRGSA